MSGAMIGGSCRIIYTRSLQSPSSVHILGIGKFATSESISWAVESKLNSTQSASVPLHHILRWTMAAEETTDDTHSGEHCANQRVRSMVPFWAAALQKQCMPIGLCGHFTSGANSNEEKAAHFGDFPFPKSLGNVTAEVDIFGKWTTDFGKGERHVCNGCITRHSLSTVVRTWAVILIRERMIETLLDLMKGCHFECSSSKSWKCAAADSGNVKATGWMKNMLNYIKGEIQRLPCDCDERDSAVTYRAHWRLTSFLFKKISKYTEPINDSHVFLLWTSLFVRSGILLFFFRTWFYVVWFMLDP